MGTNESKPAPLIATFERINAWSFKQAKKMLQDYKDKDLDFGLDVQTLGDLLHGDKEWAEKIIAAFQSTNGIINALAFICGVALVTHGTSMEKAELVFDALDFDSTEQISMDEMTIVFLCCARGFTVLSGHGSVPPDEELETITLQAYRELNKSSSQSITKKEFVAWMLKFLGNESDHLALVIMMDKFGLSKMPPEQEPPPPPPSHPNETPDEPTEKEEISSPASQEQQLTEPKQETPEAPKELAQSTPSSSSAVDNNSPDNSETREPQPATDPSQPHPQSELESVLKSPEAQSPDDKQQDPAQGQSDPNVIGDFAEAPVTNSQPVAVMEPTEPKSEAVSSTVLHETPLPQTPKTPLVSPPDHTTKETPAEPPSLSSNAVVPDPLPVAKEPVETAAPAQAPAEEKSSVVVEESTAITASTTDSIPIQQVVEPHVPSLEQVSVTDEMPQEHPLENGAQNESMKTLEQQPDVVDTSASPPTQDQQVPSIGDAPVVEDTLKDSHPADGSRAEDGTSDAKPKVTPSEPQEAKQPQNEQQPILARDGGDQASPQQVEALAGDKLLESLDQATLEKVTTQGLPPPEERDMQ